MSEGIEYGTESDFRAPVMRIDDEGHGMHGVVYDATTRQATDWDTGELKWFRDRKLVKSNEKREGDQPVPEYIFHVAVKKGRGAFTRRGEDGETVKLSSGKAALDVRDLADEDVAFVAGSAWLAKAVKSARLNVGHEFTLKRTTPARDEGGDRMTRVECDIEIIGTVDNPRPYKTETASSADIYDTADAF